MYLLPSARNGSRPQKHTKSVGEKLLACDCANCLGTLKNGNNSLASPALCAAHPWPSHPPAGGSWPLQCMVNLSGLPGDRPHQTLSATRRCNCGTPDRNLKWQHGESRALQGSPTSVMEQTIPIYKKHLKRKNSLFSVH